MSRTTADTLLPISFHPQIFGANIRLESNGSKALRHASHDNGITFTNRQIQINERVHIKITDLDETGQWLGSLCIGFTQIDPSSLQKQDLCKSAIPNLCRKSGVSYVRRLCDDFSKQMVITFYYTRSGAYYTLDGQEHGIFEGIDVRQPLWGVIDLYGNVTAVAFTTPPKQVDDSKAFFVRYSQKPDNLPIRYFPRVSPSDLQPVHFNDRHGPEIDLFCQNKVALRKNVQKLTRPYLFIDVPMKSDDELYIRILSIDLNFRTGGTIGFTNANPSVVLEHFNTLPQDDPAALVDREEFWILPQAPFDDRLEELDEYRISFQKSGQILMCRNNQTDERATVLAVVDASLTYYPFFFLNGRINALSLFGALSLENKSNKGRVEPPPNTDADLCQLCLDEKANCVLLPCGHVFFCSACKITYETKSARQCPNCRTEYTSCIEINED